MADVPMDFFARQDQARRKTKWLVAYFVLAVVLLILAVYAIALVIFSGAPLRHLHSGALIPYAWWNAPVFLGSTLGVLAVIFFGSAYKTSELSAGGSAVATLLGGRLVPQTTLNANERKLLNVVEEMSIASGVPMPQVYVLEDERGINAFAAGHTPSDAAIGVTRGCIEMLSRDELQGVIGHEFSHILNGDMRLNLRLIGLIFGLFCLATIGRILLNTRGGNSRDRNALPLLGLALVVLGAIGVFFGRLIQAAVSRQREFLADASSVQFTRNPAGLSGALQKIGRFSLGSRLTSDHAPDLCHMFFGNGLGDSLFGAMATHPPIPERIRAIDPAWDGKFAPLTPELAQHVQHAALDDLAHSPRTGLESTGSGMLAAGENSPREPGVPFLDPIGTSQLRPVASAPPVIRADAVLPNLGNPSSLHLRSAEQLRDSLPENLRAAARDPQLAMVLVLALLLDAGEALRRQQLAGIARQTSPALAARCESLYPAVAAVACRTRLPLVNLALGSLCLLSADEFRQFSATLEWLAGSDGRVELFEFVLQKIIQRHLAVKFIPGRVPPVQYYTLKPLLPDCVVILSALARVGSAAEPEIQTAFSLGVPFLRAPAAAPLGLLPLEQCGVAALDAALDRLVGAVPVIKKNLLAACLRVVGADGLILEAEAELLRAVADTLDCPLPPLGIPGDEGDANAGE